MKKLVYYLPLILLSTFTLSAQIEEGIIAWYTFDGNAEDQSGFENHGMVDGATLTTDRFGNPDSAYEFDGEDDIIRVLDDETLRMSPEFTIVAWIMPYEVKDHTLLRKGSGQNNAPSTIPAYGLGLSGTQDYTFTIATDEEAEGISGQQSGFVNPYDLDEWQVIIGRKKEDSIFLTSNEYESGLYYTYARTYEGETQYDTSPLLIGSRSQLAANTFHGKIDDIVIYDQFLSLEEATGVDFSGGTAINSIENHKAEIFPNPFDDKIYFKTIDWRSNKNASFSIYSLNGKLLEEWENIETDFVTTAHIKPGVYLVRIQNGRQKHFQKMLKL